MRIGAELLPHAPDGFLRDALRCAAPAGVHRRHYAPLRVHQQEGQAVGHLHGQQQPRPGGHHCVARQFQRTAGLALSRVRQRVNDLNHVGVALPQRDQLHALRSQTAHQALPIPAYDLRVIRNRVAQIEITAGALMAGGEAVHEPPITAQRSRLDQLGLSCLGGRNRSFHESSAIRHAVRQSLFFPPLGPLPAPPPPL